MNNNNSIILAHGAVNDGDEGSASGTLNATEAMPADDMMQGGYDSAMPGGYMMAGGFVMLIVWALAVLGAVYLIKILMSLGSKQSEDAENSNNTEHE